jgi:hypothetical protein
LGKGENVDRARTGWPVRDRKWIFGERIPVLRHNHQTPSGDPEFSLDPGTMVADYRVIARIGIDGMGEIFLDTLFDA